MDPRISEKNEVCESTSNSVRTGKLVQMVEHKYLTLLQERRCNNEARSSNHCCRGKQLCIKH